MAQPQRYLFHGNDTQQSLLARQRWEQVFYDKYGDATRHRIEADGLNVDQVLTQLQGILTAQSLFADRALCVLSRYTSLESPRSKTASERLVKLLQETMTADSLVTVVVWEDHLLPDTHVLVKWFLEMQDASRAKITVYQTPGNGVLLNQLLAPLEADGYKIAPDVRRWIDYRLRVVEKEQRVREHLRSTQVPPVDHRRWYLQSLLATAALADEGSVITVPLLEKCAGEMVGAVSPYEFVNMVERGSWADVSRLVGDWRQNATDDDYFMLYAILRKQFSGGRDDASRYALRLLAEVELLTKNGLQDHVALLTLLMVRLQEGKRLKPIVRPKTAWLASIS